MTVTSHTVQARDGVRIAFNHYHNGGGGAAVIACHGFFSSKEARSHRRFSQALVQACDVISMDFRGHGRSGGLYTFSAREDADLEAVLEWAAPRFARLGLIGFSLGAAIAINTASRHPGRVRSLVAVSAPSEFERIEFRWWTPRALCAGLASLGPGSGCRPGNLFLPKERPVERIRALSQLPVLFIHGTADPIVGLQHSRRLHEAAPGPKHLEVIPGGGHAEWLFREDPETFSRLVLSWFSRTL